MRLSNQKLDCDAHLVYNGRDPKDALPYTFYEILRRNKTPNRNADDMSDN